jgi:hypothetical protein
MRLIATMFPSMTACWAMTEGYPFCQSKAFVCGPDSEERLFRVGLPPGPTCQSSAKLKEYIPEIMQRSNHRVPEPHNLHRIDFTISSELIHHKVNNFYTLRMLLF